MIATRPDWCISRQRIWGVPIAVFLCEGCNKPIIDAGAEPQDRRPVRARRRRGLAHDATLRALLPAGAKCAHCGGTEFRKETDILDVWFDSGTSWFAVCESDPDLKAGYTALSRKDEQARSASTSKAAISIAAGSTLPCSRRSRCAAARPTRTSPPPAGRSTSRAAPCRSRSATASIRSISPNRMGGEIVRLWVASIDFREDMAASENLMQRCAELYRKLRNTFRFLLGNLNGFDPARDRVAEAELLPLDRYMLARTRELTEKILGLVRGLRIPSRLPGGERIRHRRPELVLSRRPQGPHVHLCADEPGATFRADGALADHRNAGAARCADPELHRRRSVGVSARQSQAAKPASTSRCFPSRKRSSRRPGEAAGRVEADLRGAR